MLVIDGHLDLAWNALQWNRNLLQPVYTIRTQEVDTPGPGRTQGTVALPELRRGRVAVCFATMLARSTGQPVAHLDYRTPEQAYGVAQGQLAYYHALAYGGHARLISDLATLNAHIEAWQQWDADSDADLGSAPPVGLIFSMEGADPILEPAQLSAWWKDGLRIVGPVHYGPGRYGGGTGTEAGLTPLGEELLVEMQRLGMVLDVAHFSDQAFWQALELFDGAVLASHNNSRALVPHQRQFSDDQLNAVAQRDGVIGVAFDAWMLKSGWVKGYSTPEHVSLEDVVGHIDYICQMFGSSRHVAIGTDLDGGFGREQSPHDLDTIADLQRFPRLLAERGYDHEDVAAIMHGNWLRLLRTRWRKEPSPSGGV